MTTARLLTLHDGADQVDGPDRETFVALWERASAVGKNPVALFTWMVNQPESWEWLCDVDREKARVRLCKFGKSQPKTKAAHHVMKPPRRETSRKLEKYNFAPPGDVYLPPEEASAFSDSSVMEYERRIRKCRQRKLVWIVSGVVLLLAMTRVFWT